jgi:TRAP-type C4-dicarboxylate transport system substrate-binding protein
MQAWGATAIPMDFSEMYNALSTGVVDMVALPATALMPPWRLSEVAKYVTVGLTGLFNPCGAIMNKASYAALSATQKAALDRHMGKNLSMKAGQVFDNWASNALKTATDSKKIEVIELSPSERKVLFDAAKSVIDKTVADLHKNGISDASAAYTALNK